MVRLNRVSHVLAQKLFRLLLGHRLRLQTALLLPQAHAIVGEGRLAGGQVLLLDLLLVLVLRDGHIGVVIEVLDFGYP